MKIDVIAVFLGFLFGFIFGFVFISIPSQDRKEKACYEYYKSNNGYILDSCKKYNEKWSDLDEFQTKKQVSK